MNLPKVSILIPFYNAQGVIGKTIESALNQTWPDTEVVLVDDGATDDSYKIASSYTSEKIRIFRQENKGACAARNYAFSQSTGDYIQYLDADDMLEADKIEKQLKALWKDPTKGAIASGKWAGYYGENDIRSRALKIYRDYERPVDMLADMWCLDEMMSPGVWLVPRSVIQKAGLWNESLHVNQDGEFFCRVLLNCKKIIFADCITYYRKGNQSSVSNSRFKPEKVKSLLDSFLLYEEHVEAFKNEECIRRGLADNYYYFIYTYYHLFPDLIKVAMDRVSALGLKPGHDHTGASNFKKISGVIGYYNTLRLRKFLYKLGFINGGARS